MFQSFSCISFLFKPPWIYSHFICKQNLKITNLIFGNIFLGNICNATVILMKLTKDALLDGDGALMANGVLGRFSINSLTLACFASTRIVT